MVTVHLGGPLQSAAGGRTEFEIEAKTVRELIAALSQQAPALAPVLERGVSVAIDGRIYNGNRVKEIAPDAEIFILPQLEGG